MAGLGSQRVNDENINEWHRQRQIFNKLTMN
jgi:hypothetical protein